MASTTVSAVVFPQDDGTGVPDEEESFDSAAGVSLLAEATGEQYKIGMGLSDLDTSDETVDVASGYAFVSDSDNEIQSGSQDSYDTTLPDETVYVVVLPSSETVDLGSDTEADLHLVVDPTSQDSVTIEHDESPSDPSLVIGNVDSSSDGSTDERNPGPRISPESIRQKTSDAQLQSRFDGLIVPVGPGLGIEDAFDPENFSEPLAEAIDRTPAGGDIFLPDTVDMGTDVTPKEAHRMYGLGVGDLTGSTGTKVNLPDDVSQPIKIDNDGIEMDGVGFHGPGSGETSTAIDVITFGSDDSAVGGVKFGTVGINDVYGRGMVNEGDLYESHLGKIKSQGVDAGDENAAYVFSGIGPEVVIEQIDARHNDNGSGNLSNTMYAAGGTLDIGSMNIGGYSEQLIRTFGGPVSVRQFNWEPIHSETVNHVVDVSEWTTIGKGQVNGSKWDGSGDMAYRFANISTAENILIEEPQLVNDASVGDMVRVNADVDGSVTWGGLIDDVNNTTGSTLSDPGVFCRGSIARKKSDGVGYDDGTDDTKL